MKTKLLAGIAATAIFSLGVYIGNRPFSSPEEFYITSITNLSCKVSKELYFDAAEDLGAHPTNFQCVEETSYSAFLIPKKYEEEYHTFMTYTMLLQEFSKNPEMYNWPEDSTLDDLNDLKQNSQKF